MMGGAGLARKTSQIKGTCTISTTDDAPGLYMSNTVFLKRYSD